MLCCEAMLHTVATTTSFFPPGSAGSTSPLSENRRALAFPELYQYEDIVCYLAAILEFFKKFNRAYSRRAFAKQVGHSAGFLNLVLARKRTFSESAYEKFLAYLLSRKFIFEADKKYLHALYRLNLAKDQDLRAELLEEVARLKYDRSYATLDLDELKYFNRWETLAILELVNLGDFEYSTQYLAKKFGTSIPVSDIVTNIEFLIRRGFLLKQGNKLARAEVNLSSSHDVPSAHIRDLHGQFLTLAQKQLSKVAVEKRDYSSYILSIDKDELPKAKSLIKEFRRKFSRVLNKRPGNSVYQLNIQFLPILEDESC